MVAMSHPNAQQLIDLSESFRVPAGSHLKLAKHYNPRYKAGWKKKQGHEYLKLGTELLADFQERLAAESNRGLLVVIQGIDAAGKDSTIRHVMSGVNPQGVRVNSFKVPSAQELSHDYMWRYMREVPARGQIGIFNRSHYEEVLVVRVHPHLLDAEQLPPDQGHEELWHRRHREINDWERYLVSSGITVVKLFLNISKETQRVRFLKRIDRAEKNWKFSASDVAERAFWDDYQVAFSQMLSRTSTEWAPWYVIPADRKWFARVAVSSVLVRTLSELDPQFPTLDRESREALQAARARLEAEAPPGAAPDPYKAAHGTTE
jgi:PPK2 family polyphosphate:nucleotide phosphotransferase